MGKIRLSPQQQVRLQEAFKAAFAPAKLQLLLLEVGREWTDYVVATETYPSQVLAIVKVAASDDWLIELIKAATAKLPGDLELQAIESELTYFAPRTTVNHFEVCCLTGSHILVNRATLRASLRDLYKITGKRILVVKDKTPIPLAKSNPSGKSHSVQLISYLETSLGGFELALVDLERVQRKLGPDKLVQPSDIATRMVKALGYDADIVPDRTNDGQWSRWNLEFCDLFEDVARKDPTVRWLVIDQFNLVLLPQQSVDLIKELASRINGILKNLRLILLGYADTFEQTVLPTVAEEALTEINERELIEFFARAYKELSLPMTEDDIADIVERVLKGQQALQPSDLYQIPLLARAEFDRFREGQ